MKTAIQRPTVEAPFTDSRDAAHTAQFQPAIDFFRLDARRHIPPLGQAAANETQTPNNPNET